MVVESVYSNYIFCFFFLSLFLSPFSQAAEQLRKLREEHYKVEKTEGEGGMEN